MASTEAGAAPPPLTVGADGIPEMASLADLVSWFLASDERVGRMRHPYADEVFNWKQADDAEKGLAVYPFENAEARFAIGVIRAALENTGEPELKGWITDVVEALGGARETKAELTAAYSLDEEAEAPALEKAAKLPSARERELYLSSCWLELLCTAEARVLGWIYQERFDRPFAP